MKTTLYPQETNPTITGAAPLPGDLRPSIGEQALTLLTLQAVDAVASSLPRWLGTPDSAINPQQMLTLLTFSYASATYASEDIEWAATEEDAFRYIAGSARPRAALLRAFRRANRPWIEACLAWVLERAGQMPERQAEARFGGDIRVVREEARRRLELATLMDMAMTQ